MSIAGKNTLRRPSCSTPRPMKCTSSPSTSHGCAIIGTTRAPTTTAAAHHRLRADRSAGTMAGQQVTHVRMGGEGRAVGAGAAGGEAARGAGPGRRIAATHVAARTHCRISHGEAAAAAWALMERRSRVTAWADLKDRSIGHAAGRVILPRLLIPRHRQPARLGCSADAVQR